MKANKPTAMLMIGNDRGTIQESAKAVIGVLKATSYESAQVAAVNALAALAKAPTNVTVQDCTFNNSGLENRTRKP